MTPSKRAAGSRSSIGSSRRSWSRSLASSVTRSGTRDLSASTTAALTAASCTASSKRTPARSCGSTTWSRRTSASPSFSVSVDRQIVVLAFPTGDVVRRPGQLRAGRELVGRDLGDPDAKRRVDGVGLGERLPFIERVVHRPRPWELHAKSPARGDVSDLVLVRPDEGGLLW